MTQDTINLGTLILLYRIRTRFPDCTLSNNEISKRVIVFLRREDPDCIVGERQPIPALRDVIYPSTMPKTVRDLTFNRQLLPELFTFIDNLAKL